MTVDRRASERFHGAAVTHLLAASILVLGLPLAARATIFTYRNAAGSTLSTDHPLDEGRIRAEGWVLKDSTRPAENSSPPAPADPADVPIKLPPLRPPDSAKPEVRLRPSPADPDKPAFRTLEAALAFIEDCLERDDRNALDVARYDPQWMGSIREDGFLALQRANRGLALHRVFSGREFPRQASRFEIGERSGPEEIGLVRISFLRSALGWHLKYLCLCN